MRNGGGYNCISALYAQGISEHDQSHGMQLNPAVS